MDRTHRLFGEAIDVALSQVPLIERRLLLGEAMREMFEADVFVSYVCDESGPYAEPAEIGLGRDLVNAYARHFRHVDELTPMLFRNCGASVVTPEVRSSSEFVSDFLHAGGMFHGMNYFPVRPVPGSIDLRLWRGRRSRPFSVEEARVFQSLGELVTRLWPPEADSGQRPLTPRQTEIALLVADGLSDKQICSRLDIALPTLRTHLGQAFEKTGAANRAALAAYIRSSQHP